MFKYFVVILLVTTSLNLTACGQTGPLYLPQEPSQPQTR
jgi:predicted small lipoprotein YifL